METTVFNIDVCLAYSGYGRSFFQTGLIEKIESNFYVSLIFTDNWFLRTVACHPSVLSFSMFCVPITLSISTELTTVFESVTGPAKPRCSPCTDVYVDGCVHVSKLTTRVNPILVAGPRAQLSIIYNCIYFIFYSYQYIFFYDNTYLHMSPSSCTLSKEKCVSSFNFMFDRDFGDR